ncbi:lactate utilization protein [Lachnospiraceae bacterium KGMB03038]|nr:lactate utilization protein [Lachnospiraceae bacterium KGMB03038]
MTPKKKAYRKLADTMIQNLRKRNMEGFYCEDREAARELAMEMMKEGGTVGFGGSVTLDETGILKAVEEKEGLTLIDRRKAKTPEETREVFFQTVASDYFLMSTNAITIDGELINIDGKGNRLACLVYGPKNVIIIAGMNKVTADTDSGIKRVQNVSSPANAAVFDSKTPCGITGHCGSCHSPQTMCCQVVITRHSRFDGRIKVILVGEELGH